MKYLTLVFFFSNWLNLTAQTAFLGISSSQLNTRKAAILDLPAFGVYIASINPGSAADQAGLQVFDCITQIGDQSLSDQISLTEILTNYQPEEEADLFFIRGGENMKTTVKFGDKSNAKHSNIKDENDPFLGVHETHKTASNSVPGVMVNIGDGNSADLIGMQNGDLITYVDQFRIVDWHDLRTAIDNRNVGDLIEVTVLRNGNYTTLYGPIKSENGHTPLDKKIDMQYMDVELSPIPEEEKKIFPIVEENQNKMNTLELVDLSVFPNPSIGRFTLEIEVSSQELITIGIYDSQGKQIINNSFSPRSGYLRENFDLGNNPAGVYYLKVVQGNSIMTRKLIVARS